MGTCGLVNSKCFYGTCTATSFRQTFSLTPPPRNQCSWPTRHMHRGSHEKSPFGLTNDHETQQETSKSKSPKSVWISIWFDRKSLISQNVSAVRTKSGSGMVRGSGNASSVGAVGLVSSPRYLDSAPVQNSSSKVPPCRFAAMMRMPKCCRLVPSFVYARPVSSRPLTLMF